jgi:hypothetical protein
MSPAELFWYVEAKLPPEKDSKHVLDEKWLELAARLD